MSPSERNHTNTTARYPSQHDHHHCSPPSAAAPAPGLAPLHQRDQTTASPSYEIQRMDLQTDRPTSQRLSNHSPSLRSSMTTTLEAAEQYGKFSSVKAATRFLAEHGLQWSEAYADLGEDALDAVKLCEWIGY